MWIEDGDIPDLPTTAYLCLLSYCIALHYSTL